MHNSDSVEKHLEMLDEEDDSEPELSEEKSNVIAFPIMDSLCEEDEEEDDNAVAARGRFIIRRNPLKRGKLEIIGEIDEDVLFHSQELWIGDIALCPDSRYYSHKKRGRDDLSTMVAKGGLNKRAWRKQVELKGE